LIECEGCQFWNGINPELGECRRNAPVIRSIQGEQTTSFWPYTSKTDGCGQGEVRVNSNNEGNEDLT